MSKHLYEFESSGFYAAESREEAIDLVMTNLHYDRDDAEGDFVRDVPDDEVIKATSEDSWEHPRQLCEVVNGSKYAHYHLELPAVEHAAIAPEHGYCFGGEQ